MEKKYRLTFNRNNIGESVSYVLVSKFNIIPNVLQASIDGEGGKMILSMKGENVEEAVKQLESMGIKVKEMSQYVKRDMDKCIDCGSCVSVCPTFSFDINRETWDVTLDTDKCVACGSCVSACPTHAVSLRV